MGLLSDSSTAVVLLVLLVVPSRAASGAASHCPLWLRYCEPGVLLVNMLVITMPGVAPAHGQGRCSQASTKARQHCRGCCCNTALDTTDGR